jgi:hypothetical protein
MTVDMRSMRTKLAAAGALIALALGLAGCGGSGSSGFDAIAASEASVIAQAIDESVCIDFEEQKFCASGVEPQSGLFVGASVIIEEPAAPLVCDGNTPQPDDCTAPLEFTTEGFTTVNSLLAAVARDERGPWELVPLNATDEVMSHRVTIEVPAETHDTDPRPFIAAVLVYAGTPPEDLPKVADSLRTFEVDLVYVSSRLEIVVPR